MIYACLGVRLIKGWIRNYIGKRLLDNIVKPDPQHKHIKAFFEDPIYLSLPILKIPMLRLEAVKASVGKIAKSAIFKAR